MLLIIIFSCSVAAGLNDAKMGIASQRAGLRAQLENSGLQAESLESHAGKPWDNKMSRRAASLKRNNAQLLARNKMLTDKIRELSKAHEHNSRTLLYKMETIRPRAEFTETLEGKVLELRAENETRSAREAKLVVELREKTELLRSTQEKMQHMENELRGLRSLTEERARMYSELNDEKNRIEDQFKVQIRNKEKQIRELHLFSNPTIEREECRQLLSELRSIEGDGGEVVSEHQSSSPMEIGWKNKYSTNFYHVGTKKKDLAKERIKDSITLRAQLSDLMKEEEGDETTATKPHAKNAKKKETELHPLGFAKGANIVQFSKNKLPLLAAKKKFKNARDLWEQNSLKAEKKAKAARETLSHTPSSKDEKKLNATEDAWTKGLKWLSQVYKNNKSPKSALPTQ